MTGSTAPLEKELRAATLNVRTLSTRARIVEELLEEQCLDVLCLQETRVGFSNRAAMEGAMRQKNREMFTCEAREEGPNTFEGVAIITNWPAELYPLPDRDCYKHRAIAVRLYRKGKRPLICACVYAHASDAAKRAELHNAIVMDCSTSGEDYLILGDWNGTPFELPLASLLAAGSARWADDNWQFESQGTTRTSTGRIGRHIDYGVHSDRVRILQREQHLGPADHDLIVYTVDADRGDPGRRRLRPAPVLPPEDAQQDDATDKWTETWLREQASFRDLLKDKEVEHAWTALSGAAEEALTGQRPRGATRRSEVRAPVLPAEVPQKTEDMQLSKERKLWRAARRAKALQADPVQPGLLRKLRLLTHSLQHEFEDLRGLDPGAEHASAVFEACARLQGARDKKRAIEAFKRKARESHRELYEWIARNDNLTQEPKKTHGNANAQPSSLQEVRPPQPLPQAPPQGRQDPA